ncbi:MAG: hypothetical protein RJA70_4105, partial [Pseudomonadota bacterium]
MKSSIAYLSSIIVLASCSSGSVEPVNLGDDQVDSVELSLSSFEGSWDGYVEAYQFPSGSDRLRIVLDASGHGGIELGEAPPIPPFRDPTKRYPEGVGMYSEELAFEGFAYPALEAEVIDGRIKLSSELNALYKDFCAAQTGYEQVDWIGGAIVPGSPVLEGAMPVPNG